MYLKFVWPVDVCMLHHGSGLLGNDANRSLSDAILVVCTDTRKLQLLIRLCEKLGKFLGFEDAIIAVVILDLDTT
jgi:hypothetical protein